MNEMLSEPKAAARLGVCSRTLMRWRFKGEGPPYIRYTPGGNATYLSADLDAWIRSRKFGGEMG